MEFRFDPWMLDVDVNATQHNYSKNDYSKEKQLNEELKKAMSFQQSRIFETLGVDPDKILVEKIPLEGSQNVYKFSFMVKGKLLTITNMQAAVYSDEKVFGPEILDHVEVVDIPEGGVMVYEMGNLALAFKHPGHTKEWNCGSVLGVGFIQL